VQGAGEGEVLGVGFDEAEGGLLGGGEEGRALLAYCEHGAVDVGDGHAD
jgi:hypothetical protein